MNHRSRFSLIIVALLILSLTTIASLTAQGAVEQLVIIDTDATEFPQVDLTVRALDSQGRAVPGLLPADFEISENDRPMTIDAFEEVDGGLWVHFVIDAGAGMQSERWTRAQSAIRGFLESDLWMRNGLDKVAITAVEAGGPRLLIDYSSDRAQLLRALDQYSYPGGEAFSAPLPAVTDLIEQLDLKPEARNRPKYVVLVSAGLENETGHTTLIETARERDVVINTVLARSVARLICEPSSSATRGACDERLRDAGLETGGEFSPYVDRNSLNGMFTRMQAQRRQYDISYRSNLGDSGTHQVVVAHPGGTRATSSYSVEINPIRVLIDAPKEGESIVREATVFTPDRSSIPPTSYTVVASAVFPDVRRRIVQAELLVNGAVAARQDFPGETFELPWSLRAITGLGINDQTLQVRIIDELGLESVSQPANVKVEVIVPTEIVLPDGTIITDTTVITITEVLAAPTPTPIPCPLPEGACGPYRAVRSNWLSATSLAVALMALTFAGVVYINRDKEVVRNATARVTRVVESITRRDKNIKARAYLEIISGDSDIGRLLPLHGDTRIGRSKQDAQIHFQSGEEDSVISRLHCTIIDEETHFEIKDETSTYGTYLNGSRLMPQVPEKLAEGDEIELAQVQRGGVKLRFKLADDADDAVADGGITKRTRKEQPSAGDGAEQGRVDPF